MNRAGGGRAGQYWESIARTDPYWGVFTDERYRKANLTDEAKARFFATGEGLVTGWLKVLANRFNCPQQVDTALEFGCGVGRLLLPLARRSRRAIGVDVSPTMLQHCAENARDAGLDNVELVGDLASLDPNRAALDLVLSFVVFQHIPTDAGMGYLDALLSLLRPGGWGFVHLTYANDIGHIPKEGADTGAPYRYYQRRGDQLLRFGKGPPPAEPRQEMNHYNLNQVMCLLVDNRVFRHFATHTRHAGVLGTELYFQKATGPRQIARHG
jgi:SAM-dependent methyltransferase